MTDTEISCIENNLTLDEAWAIELCVQAKEANILRKALATAHEVFGYESDRLAELLRAVMNDKEKPSLIENEPVCGWSECDAHIDPISFTEDYAFSGLLPRCLNGHFQPRGE